MGGFARRTGRVITTDAGSSTTRGLLGVLTGVAVVAWPDASLTVLAVVFGCYAVLHGALALLGLLWTRTRSWQRAAQGVTSLAAGLTAFAWPDLTRSMLLYVLAVWVVAMGALRLRVAIHFGDRVTVSWVHATLSMLAVVAGCTVFVAPDRGLQALMINVAVFPVLDGVALLAHRGEP